MLSKCWCRCITDWLTQFIFKCESLQRHVFTVKAWECILINCEYKLFNLRPQVGINLSSDKGLYKSGDDKNYWDPKSTVSSVEVASCLEYGLRTLFNLVGIEILVHGLINGDLMGISTPHLPFLFIITLTHSGGPDMIQTNYMEPQPQYQQSNLTTSAAVVIRSH